MTAIGWNQPDDARVARAFDFALKAIAQMRGSDDFTAICAMALLMSTAVRDGAITREQAIAALDWAIVRPWEKN